MEEEANAIRGYPLEWPVTWPRTPAEQRSASRYKVSQAQARDDLIAEVGRLWARRYTISCNVPLRRDGTPYAEWREPEDPGVAVYWEDAERKRTVVPCDRWRTVRKNMRAATLAIEALRALKRSGAGQVVDRAFAGLMLPERAGASDWRTELGVSVNATREEIRSAYRKKVMVMHPDKGGDPVAWHRLNQALAAAELEA